MKGLFTSDFACLLDKLYSATETPFGEEHSFLGSAEIKARIDSLLSRPSRDRYEALSDEEIASFVDFVLRLVDTPLSLKGAALVADQMKILLFSAFRELGLPLSEIKSLLDLTRDWYYVLTHSPDKARYLSLPHIRECMLLRFHVDAWRASSCIGAIRPSLYRAYGFAMHMAIRWKQQQPAQDDTIDGYGLIARDFFNYIPWEMKVRKSHPGGMTSEYFNAFARGYDIAEYANHNGQLTPSARRKLKCLQRLVRLSEVVPHAHSGSREGRPPHSDPDRDILNAECPGDHEHDEERHRRMPRIDRGFLTSTIEELELDDPDMDEESEAFEPTLSIPVFWPREKNLTRKPTLRREWAERINLRNFKFSWASQFLQPFHYAVIHAKLRTLWGMDPYTDCIIGFIYVLIHAGVDDHRLIRLANSSDDIASRPVLTLHADRNYIVIPALVCVPSPPPADICLKNSDVVWVPLPEPIHAMFEEIGASGQRNVFSYADREGAWRQLSLFDVDRFLDRHISGCCKFHPFNVSRALIGNSFLPLYRSHGMDPLKATIISGADRHRLYRSQLHYTHIDHSSLEREYLDTFARVTETITATLEMINCTGFKRSLDGA